MLSVFWKYVVLRLINYVTLIIKPCIVGLVLGSALLLKHVILELL